MPYLHTFNDEPVLECKLNRDSWLTNIVHNIYTTIPPKTFAIHGTWGTGKTSELLKLYWAFGGNMKILGSKHQNTKLKCLNYRENDKAPHTKAIWFEAWKYQHESNITLALLKEVRNQLTAFDKFKDDLANKSSAFISSIISSIDSVMLEVSTSSGTLPSGISGKGRVTLKNPINNFNEKRKEQKIRNYDFPLASMEISELLQNAIDALLKLHRGKIADLWKTKIKPKPEDKLIIIIDDLDRCTPEKAFQILETIKVNLNLRNCIFVIGMDQEAIEQIIKKHFDDLELESNKNIARLYLEKICQEIHHIPALVPAQRKDYLIKLLTDAKVPNKIIEELGKIMDDYTILPSIPRSIKIYVNTIINFLNNDEAKKYLDKGIRGGNSQNTKIFLVMTYLYSFHYEVYQLTYLYEGFFRDALFKFCDTGKTQHKVLDNIILPLSSRASEESSFEAKPPLNEDGTPKKNLSRTKQFPYYNPRQILWIRDLILDEEVKNASHNIAFDALNLL